MTSYNSSDVERLLRVKTHVIRYWEKEIPLIQPEKNKYGRRVYRDRDLQILLRLKYLLYERRFTLEGAREQLYNELTGEHQDLRAHISALRSELLKLFSQVSGHEDDEKELLTNPPILPQSFQPPQTEEQEVSWVKSP